VIFFSVAYIFRTKSKCRRKYSSYNNSEISQKRRKKKRVSLIKNLQNNNIGASLIEGLFLQNSNNVLKPVQINSISKDYESLENNSKFSSSDGEVIIVE
jgi:hypothetical protein